MLYQLSYHRVTDVFPRNVAPRQAFLTSLVALF